MWLLDWYLSLYPCTDFRWPHLAETQLTFVIKRVIGPFWPGLAVPRPTYTGLYLRVSLCGPSGTPSEAAKSNFSSGARLHNIQKQIYWANLFTVTIEVTKGHISDPMVPITETIEGLSGCGAKEAWKWIYKIKASVLLINHSTRGQDLSVLMRLWKIYKMNKTDAQMDTLNTGNA